jgi:nitrogen fixation NifU-like protein
MSLKEQASHPLPAELEEFARQQGISATLADHMMRPRHVGELEKPDGWGQDQRSCGDELEFFLYVRQGAVQRVTYAARSCGVTIACASMAASLAQGQPAVELRRSLDPQAVIDALGGLPPGEEHCAELVVGALRAALDDFFRTEREPWRRVYRNR